MVVASVQRVYQIEAFFAGIGGLEDFSFVFSPNPDRPEPRSFGQDFQDL
jgi:hypothetical protein